MSRTSTSLVVTTSHDETSFIKCDHLSAQCQETMYQVNQAVKNRLLDSALDILREQRAVTVHEVSPAMQGLQILY